MCRRARLALALARWRDTAEAWQAPDCMSMSMSVGGHDDALARPPRGKLAGDDGAGAMLAVVFVFVAMFLLRIQP